MENFWEHFLAALDRWQALIAGALGFGAAIWTVRRTLQAEERKTKREIETLRHSLGVEIRQCVGSALAMHRSLRRLAQMERRIPITSWMIENSGPLLRPVVYPASADKIGLL